MRVYGALVLVLCIAGAAAQTPAGCGLPNEQVNFETGSVESVRQGFYAVGRADIPALINLFDTAPLVAPVLYTFIEVSAPSESHVAILWQSDHTITWNRVLWTGDYLSSDVTVVVPVDPSARVELTGVAGSWISVNMLRDPVTGHAPYDPVQNAISPLTAKDIDGGAIFNRISNDGLSTSTNPALLNVPILHGGIPIDVAELSLLRVGPWFPCVPPVGCVDAQGNACTSIIRNQNCQTAIAKTTTSTCVSLDFSTAAGCGVAP
jgi:hypothetical protein